jgi:fido (protein-threonine AMPylation protein)
MILYDEIELSPFLQEKLDLFTDRVDEFRAEGPLDPVSLTKLEEYFKAAHIYHSAGIEGNRLTMQETALVLSEGLDISGKPLKDTLEVKRLGDAFNYLKTLAAGEQKFREDDIRALHKLLVGDDLTSAPGEYRKVGVIISGSEHRPPEPFEVPFRMEALVKWINANLEQHPVVAAAVAHHELTAIHPFVDGNGRTARLAMNLILMKRGFPICNIQRAERPAYYEALSFADVGLYQPLLELVLARCADSFAEYVRLREENRHMEAWAQKWGDRAAGLRLRHEASIPVVQLVATPNGQRLAVLDMDEWEAFIQLYFNRVPAKSMDWLSLAGSIPQDDLKQITEAIEAGCEKIDFDEW